MKIHTLWIWRKSSEGPELAEAWDEVTVDENHVGWLEACENRLKEYGDDVYAHRPIDIEVDYEKVEQVFLTPTIDAEVQS